MKTLYKIITIVLFVVTLGTTANAQTAVDAYGQLSISGNKVVDKNNNPVQLRGMSLFWSQWISKYYRYETIEWLRDDWCVNVIRIPLAASQGGYEVDPTGEMAKVETVIDACIALGIYVIVDFHDHDAHNKLSMAQDFFGKVSLKYANSPNVLYEIYNEPLNVSWSNTIKPYCQSVISTIRANDPDNIIICGTPNWSQDVEQASFDPINQSNIAYTLHYYASSHGQSLRNKANTALSNGIALIVTEYGVTEASGDGNINVNESNTWWDWMDQNKITSCNWSIADKNENSAALVANASPLGNWSASDLTTSGTMVRAEIKANCPDYGVPPVITYQDVPSKVEAEDFSSMLGVQTEATTDVGAGLNVGWIGSGDWMEYRINALSAGDYNFDYRLAANGSTGSFDVFIDNNLIHSVNVTNTGGWQDWVTISNTGTMTAGQHIMRIVATGADWNINYIDISGLALVDCNGDANGTAFIDGCGVCAGGNTGNVPNASCSGACQSGYGPNGVFDDFTLETDPYNQVGGMFSWGEPTLGGDNNPNFRATLNRDDVAKQLDVTITQGQGEYVPFGFSFGDVLNPPTIDISNDGTFEFEINNSSTDDLTVSIAIKDINGNLINTYGSASGEPFADAWIHAISLSIDGGTSKIFAGDFSNGFHADYGAGQYVSTFDYSKVANIQITVVNKTSTGPPSYQPLAISNATINLLSARVGDCSGASNINNLPIDCHGDVNGTAAEDVCGVCAGGNTGVVPTTNPNDCVITGVNELDNTSFQVFPSPTSGQVHLSEEKSWVLYNLFGELISEGTSNEIDLSDDASGMYLIHVDGEVFRIIKQ